MDGVSFYFSFIVILMTIYGTWGQVPRPSQSRPIILFDMLLILAIAFLQHYFDINFEINVQTGCFLNIPIVKAAVSLNSTVYAFTCFPKQHINVIAYKAVPI